MRYALLILLFSLTACDSGKSGAEISAIGEGLTSDSSSPLTAASPAPLTCSHQNLQPLGGGNGCIDPAPRSVKTYAQADAACVAASMSLCTHDFYLAAYQHGLLTLPNFLWEQPYAGTNFLIDNTLYVTTGNGSANSDQQQPAANNQKFYCCGAGI
jgi:hypothetical protein